MLTVQYNGPEKTINGAVWYRGETRHASPKQLAGWQAEHGDVFVVAGGAVVIQDGVMESDQADTGRATEAEPKVKRK